MRPSQLERMDAWQVTGSAPTRRDKGLRLARRMYLPRSIGLALGGMAVGAAMYQAGAPSWAWWLLACNAFVWPHLAYQLAARSTKPFEHEVRNLQLDAAFGGFWVPMMQFNLLPSVLILSMLSMDNLSVGGLRLFLQGLLASLLGVTLATALLGVQVTLESDLTTTVASLPLLVGFPLTIGVITFKLASELNEKTKRLYWVSQRDALSGLFGRVYWERRLDEELQYFLRHGRTATLIVADVDHFKDINDGFGHLLGDEVIQSLGRILREHVREGDIAARLGGDEFSILLPQATVHDAMIVTRRIQSALAQHLFGEGPGAIAVSMSYGIVALDKEIRTRKQWIELADQALYAVKRARRGGVHVHNTVI